MLKVDIALQIWSNINENPTNSLKRLEDKSLVKIGKDGGLETHDQLQDMGRMIVETQSNYMGTRLWNIHATKWKEEIGKDMRHMESLSCNEPTKGVKYMDMKEPLPSLRLFNYQGCESLISIGPIVNHSRHLSCLLVNCEQKDFMPKSVQMQNPISSVKWENHVHLRVLVIKGVSTLEALPDNIYRLVSLYKLMIKNCYQLKHLPRAIGSLSSLRELNLRGCRRLENIPIQVGNLTSLTALDLRYCKALKEIPEALGNLTSLTTLNLSYCDGLKEIPEALGMG
jgi:hypothetical protein